MSEQRSVTRRVVARIREIRTQRGITAEALAKSMTEVGYPVDRTKIAKAENGIREQISVDWLNAAAEASTSQPPHSSTSKLAPPAAMPHPPVSRAQPAAPSDARPAPDPPHAQGASAVNLDDAATPACTVCTRALYADELGHQGCRPCADRTDQNLRAIAGPDGLYARLSGRLIPGSRNGGPSVSGSRTAPLPLRLEPLSLLARGGIVTILQTWLIDWHEHLGWTHPRWNGDLQQQCDDVVKRLRINLPWAAASHPAFDEFARESSQLRRQCEGQVTGEKPPRRIPVACPCGHILKVTLDTAGVRCPACGTQYGHSEALQLPHAGRIAA